MSKRKPPGELSGKKIRIIWTGIFMLVVGWGIFVYLLLYHGWIFGIH